MDGGCRLPAAVLRCCGLLLPVLLARPVRDRGDALLTPVVGAGGVLASLALLETALML